MNTDNMLETEIFMPEPIREKLILTAQEARDILYGDVEEELFTIINDEIIDTSRWSTIHSLVIQRNSDKKYFCDTYSRAATEVQDEQPWEYSEPEFVEVFKAEKVVTVYI